MAKTLLEALNVKMPEQDIFDIASKKYRVPKKFLKTIYRIESTSGTDKRAGTNVMQLTPIALKELNNNYGGNHTVDSPDESILNSAKYLRWLANKKKLNFNDNAEEIAYRYNAGAYAKGNPNKSAYVKKYRKYNSVPTVEIGLDPSYNIQPSQSLETNDPNNRLYQMLINEQNKKQMPASNMLMNNQSEPISSPNSTYSIWGQITK